MKKRGFISGIDSLALVCAASAAIPTVAQASTISAGVHSSGIQIMKRCDFYVNGQCYDHWVPSSDSCRNIFQTKAPEWQKRACLAWSGYGSRG